VCVCVCVCVCKCVDNINSTRGNLLFDNLLIIIKLCCVCYIYLCVVFFLLFLSLEWPIMLDFIILTSFYIFVDSLFLLLLLLLYDMWGFFLHYFICFIWKFEIYVLFLLLDFLFVVVVVVVDLKGIRIKKENKN
jgi:hypothetical protein